MDELKVGGCGFRRVWSLSTAQSNVSVALMANGAAAVYSTLVCASDAYRRLATSDKGKERSTNRSADEFEAGSRGAPESSPGHRCVSRPYQYLWMHG